MKISKKILSVLLAVAMTVCLLPAATLGAAADGASDASGNVTLEVDKTSVLVGDTVTVTVSCKDMKVISFVSILHFDPDMFECTGVTDALGKTKGYLFSKEENAYVSVTVLSSPMDANIATAGRVGFVLAGFSDVNYGASVLMTVTFRAKKSGVVDFQMSEATDGTNAAEYDAGEGASVTVGVSEEPLDETYSGTCGESLTWLLDTETHTLTVSGTGEMWRDSSYAPWYSYRRMIRSLVIEPGVTTISDWAFFDCSSLKYVTIADSVTEIDDYAFLACEKMASITIPASVTEIGDGAFADCLSLATVKLPDSVTAIGSDAFINTALYNDLNKWGSDALYIGNHLIEAKYEATGDYTVRAGTKTIAENAFFMCENLRSITIPASVTNIGSYAFTACYSLTDIHVAANNPAYSETDGVLFDKDKTTLVCFPAAKSGAYTVPDSVTVIGDGAFETCAYLTGITIPDTVTTIGDYAFFCCTSLSTVTIPASVASIGTAALSACYSLTGISVSADNPAYSEADGLLFNKDKTELMCCPCTKRGAYAIPDSVIFIDDWAFAGCEFLYTVTIPDSVVGIGDYAFSGCAGLSDVYYLGTQEQWDAIMLGTPSEEFLEATLHFGPAPVAAPGDVTGDGSVDASDLTMHARHVGGIVTLTGVALTAADFDGNGTVDASDLTALARKVGGIA